MFVRQNTVFLYYVQNQGGKKESLFALYNVTRTRSASRLGKTIGSMFKTVLGTMASLFGLARKHVFSKM